MGALIFFTKGMISKKPWKRWRHRCASTSGRLLRNLLLKCLIWRLILETLAFLFWIIDHMLLICSSRVWNTIHAWGHLTYVLVTISSCVLVVCDRLSRSYYIIYLHLSDIFPWPPNYIIWTRALTVPFAAFWSQVPLRLHPNFRDTEKL